MQDPDPAELIAELGNRKKCNYYFIKCNSSTDKMIRKFKEAHANSRKDFEEVNLGKSNEASDLLKSGSSCF